MKFIASFIIINLLLANFSFAKCDQPVTHLNVGEEAPCEGFLFSPEKEKELRLLNDNYEFSKSKIEILKKRVNLYKQDNKLLEQIIEKERKKANLWRQRAEESTKALIEYDSSIYNNNFVMISLGVVLTVASGWAIGQVSR